VICVIVLGARYERASATLTLHRTALVHDAHQQRSRLRQRSPLSLERTASAASAVRGARRASRLVVRRRSKTPLALPSVTISKCTPPCRPRKRCSSVPAMPPPFASPTSARRLDRQLPVIATCRSPRRTFRGLLRKTRSGARFGRVRLHSVCPVPCPPAPVVRSHGGLRRDLFFSKIVDVGVPAVFGKSGAAVISPCPTVHRFVVTQ